MLEWDIQCMNVSDTALFAEEVAEIGEESKFWVIGSGSGIVVDKIELAGVDV